VIFAENSALPKTTILGWGDRKIFGTYQLRSIKLRKNFERGLSHLCTLYVYQDPQIIGFCRKTDEKVVFSEDSAPLKNHFFGVGWPKNFRPAPNGVHKAQKNFFMVLAPFPHSVRIQDPKSGDFGRK